MQTFLPYPDFEQSARCLDSKRLGKQRVECKQILSSLTIPGGWTNHPATQMWKGCEKALCDYGLEVCLEWIRRGYNDSLFDYFTEQYSDFFFYKVPSWLGNASFHSSHRAALLAKNFEWYSQFGWTETPAIDYVWPTKVGLTDDQT